MSHFDESYFHTGDAKPVNLDPEPTPLVAASQPAGLENALRQQAQEPADVKDEPVTAAEVHPPEDLASLGVPELRKRAAAAGVNVKGLKKAEIVAKLSA